MIGDSGYSGEPTKVMETRDEQSFEFKEFLARAKIVKRLFIGGSRALIFLACRWQ